MELQLDLPARRRHVRQAQAHRASGACSTSCSMRSSMRGHSARPSSAGKAGAKRRSAASHGRGPSGRIAEVDALEHGMQTFAGHRTSREAQDVVGLGRRGRAGRSTGVGRRRHAQIMVHGRVVVARAMRQAAVAADPPRAWRAAAAGQGGQRSATAASAPAAPPGRRAGHPAPPAAPGACASAAQAASMSRGVSVFFSQSCAGKACAGRPASCKRARLLSVA